MVRLVIDTSLSVSNLALEAAGSRYLSQLDSSQQAEHLVSEIDGLMNQAGIEYDAISELVSVVGPGSFTGIRVGLSAARALLLAYPKMRSYTISSLHAMALSAAGQAQGLLHVVNRAGKGEVYEQQFFVDGHVVPSADPKLNTPKSSPVERGTFLAGNGVNLLSDEQRAGASETGVERIDPNALLDVPINALKQAAPEPLYIRAPDAVKAIKQGQ